jgi:hypothetical protein
VERITKNDPIVVEKAKVFSNSVGYNCELLKCVQTDKAKIHTEDDN